MNKMLGVQSPTPSVAEKAKQIEKEMKQKSELGEAEEK